MDISVDKLPDLVPDYVGAARRDPDGSAIRLSLQRRVSVNTMTAGERIFVDFLPDSWTGPPPSLPADVIRELAARARAAERALRAQLAVAAAKKKPPVRVRASVQPTFVRFVFEMPNGVNVSSVLNDQKLSLQFNSVLAFDLADAKVAAPPNIASISQRTDVDSSAVDITLIGEVDVHSFREEKNYVIDVAFQQVEKPRGTAILGGTCSGCCAGPGQVGGGRPDSVRREHPRQTVERADAGAAAAACPACTGHVGDDRRASQDRDQAWRGPRGNAAAGVREGAARVRDSAARA